MSVNEDEVVRIHRRVSDALSQHDVGADRENRQPLSGDDRRQFTRSLISQEISELHREMLSRGETLTSEGEAGLEAAVYSRMFGLGRIQQYVDDESITDIFINGFDVVWLVRRDGTKVQGRPVAGSDQELIEMIQAQARRGQSEKRWDFSSPTLDLQLPSGDRLNAMAWVTDRPSVSIRRHDFGIYRLKQLVGQTLSQSLYYFLRAAVAAKLNIIVAGGTGAGKTTLLRCLINELDPLERLITIEDSLELGVKRFGDLHRDVIETEAREANVEGVGEFDMASLVRNSLRQKPDRVIVGEIRGAEVLPMMLAMSQGNDGSLSTVHADSSAAVFSRIQMYMAMTPERFDVPTTNLMVANAIDLVVHITQLPTQERVVTSVREVKEADGNVVASNEIYGPDDTGRAVPQFKLSDHTRRKMLMAGFDLDWLAPHRGRWSDI